MARAFLHCVLGRAHCRLPSVQLGSFVDDVHLLVQASRSALAGAAAAATMEFNSLLTESKLVLADKTVLIGSDKAIAKEAVQLLEKQG
eukprot:7376270-Lingulodinium_polyedra.AAC.1